MTNAECEMPKQCGMAKAETERSGRREMTNKASIAMLVGLLVFPAACGGKKPPVAKPMTPPAPAPAPAPSNPPPAPPQPVPETTAIPPEPPISDDPLAKGDLDAINKN